MKRISVWLLTIAVFSGLSTSCRSPERSAGEETGSGAEAIVLITVDGLVPSELGLFGGSLRLPALERLASGGRAWGDAWTACPMPRPAATTCLTGRLPERHGVVDDIGPGLPDEATTLASALAERGYETAAFPDSVLLGRNSGLLRGFSVVDEPAPAGMGFERWAIRARAAGETGAHFRDWLGSLPPGARCFAWIHFSGPLLARMDPERPSVAKAIEEFDRALGAILGALDARGATSGIAVVVAGTLGDPGGGGEDLPGLGFAVGARAVEVPIVARLPGGFARSGWAEGAVTWSPDVAATLARVGGVALPDAAGSDLAGPGPGERIVLSRSWAPLEQMGWPALRAARLGFACRTEGWEARSRMLGKGGGAVPADVDARLSAALAGMQDPPPAPLDEEKIVGILREMGIEPRAAPASGRRIEASSRRAAAEALWRSRGSLQKGLAREAVAALGEVFRHDPQARVALSDGGLLLLLGGENVSRGRDLLREGAALYPRSLDSLHWLAHGEWQVRREAAARLVEMLVEAHRRDPDLLYDVACARSLAGDLEGAEAWLRRAATAGYRNWEHVTVDPDLRALRESARFAPLMREISR